MIFKEKLKPFLRGVKNSSPYKSVLNLTLLYINFEAVIPGLYRVPGNPVYSTGQAGMTNKEKEFLRSFILGFTFQDILSA
jgi:hypothetical protein